MKTKLKNLTTLDIVIYSLYGVAVILFIISALPTLVFADFRWNYLLAYAVRFTPYLVLGATAVFSNKYNVRRLVTLNLIYLSICFFISQITDFHIVLINANAFMGIDNIPFYMVIIFATLFLGGIISHCSNGWVYFYGYAMSIISFARATAISIKYDDFDMKVWLMAFSIAAYFFTLIAASERFSEENKYTNLCDKVFGDIEDELDEKSNDNEYYIHGAFKVMMAESIADENENISRYYDFYETLKSSDFVSMAEKGFLKREFITEFCRFVSAYLDKETTTEQEIVLNNITKILANENTDNNTYKKELLNLYYLIAKDFVVDPVNCADKLDIKFKSDNETEKVLSNFAEYPFEIEGVQIKSMEGFLQSLKFKSRKKQVKICQMNGKTAKRKGKYHNFWKWNGGNLYWQGKRINRFSNEYQNLLSNAYAAMLDSNEDFRNVLLSTIDENGVQKLFKHSVGKDNPQDTILTTEEFTDRLYGLRKYLINEMENKND